jgi:hypothetical protein
MHCGWPRGRRSKNPIDSEQIVNIRTGTEGERIQERPVITISMVSSNSSSSEVKINQLTGMSVSKTERSNRSVTLECLRNPLIHKVDSCKNRDRDNERLVNRDMTRCNVRESVLQLSILIFDQQIDGE